MKVLNTRRISEKMMEYFEIRNLDTIVGLNLTAPIVNGYKVEKQYYADLDCAARGLQQHLGAGGLLCTYDQAVMLAIADEIIRESLGISDGQIPVPAPVMMQIVAHAKVFHDGDFSENPYLKNIHFEKQKIGKFQLTHDTYDKYELFMYDAPFEPVLGLHLPSIGTFDHRFRYPAIREDGYTWMSVTPNEITTMEPSINDASGNVLTLGLGMGYWAYMVSEKPEVEHVTVIEREPDVINLFNAYILPQFGHKEKITVIQADAFEYMQALDDGQFDYCFADIWISSADTEPYLKLKQICRKFSRMKMEYWIEKSLVATIMSFVNIVIMEGFNQESGTNPQAESYLSESQKSSLQFFKELLKDAEITKPEHLDYFLDYRNILSLL